MAHPTTVASSTLYVQVPQNQPLDEDFKVCASDIRFISRTAAQHSYVISNWNTILFDFLPDAPEQREATSLLKDHSYEKAIMYTLECWSGRGGSLATFQACLAILEARNCSTLVTELRETLLKKPRNPNCPVEYIILDSGHVPPMVPCCEKFRCTCCCEMFRRRRKCKICLLITFILIIGLILLWVIGANSGGPSGNSSLVSKEESTLRPTVNPERYRGWNKSVTNIRMDPEDIRHNSSDPSGNSSLVSKEESTLRLTGRPGRYRRWNKAVTNIRMDPEDIRHLEFTYVYLGVNQSAFLLWLGKCKHLLTIRMHHIRWDKDSLGYEKVELPQLLSYELTKDNNDWVDSCSESSVEYINSLLFFYKDISKQSLDQSPSMDTSISISTSTASCMDHSHSKTWFELTRVEKSLTLNWMPASFLVRISSNFEFLNVTFARCTVNPTSDFSALTSLRSIALVNVESSNEGHHVSQVFRTMHRLELLHYGGPGDGIDLADVVSSKLRNLILSSCSITLSDRNHNFQVIESVHLHDIDLADEELSKAFHNTATFILTSNPNRPFLSEGQDRVRQVYEIMMMAHTRKSMSTAMTTVKYSVYRGKLQTYYCSGEEYCTRDPCLPTMQYTLYDISKNGDGFHEVCQKCIAGCEHSNDASSDSDYKQMMNQTLKLKDWPFGARLPHNNIGYYFNLSEINGFVYRTD